MLNYRDIRGANSDEPDGKIDDNDKEWIIKHTKSPINYGFSVGGAWKGLSVDLFFQGVAGGKRFYDQRTEWEGKLPHMHGGQIIGHRRTQMPSSQGQEPTTELPKNRLSGFKILHSCA